MTLTVCLNKGEKMKIVEEIKEYAFNKKVNLYVDMDGVIAEYDFGKPLDFLNKRPLLNNIKLLEEISRIKNVDIHILSICKRNFEIRDKNVWLDNHAPFFPKSNRHIISKETYKDISSADLKINFLNSQNGFKILIDDDNDILKKVSKNVKDIVLYQDSSLVY